MSQRAILCPRCRQIIGSEESHCSWCGTSRSNPFWVLIGAAGGNWVTGSILTVNILFFGLSLLLSTKVDPSSGFLSPGHNSLLLLGASGTVPIDHFGRYWSVVSANYLHGGILHLFFNLMAFRQLAPWVVNEYGSSRMFVIYTLGGVAGYLVSYFAGVPFTVGASAALCSLIGALLYYGKSRGGNYGRTVYREIGGWALSIGIFGLIFPGINNWAHGGGVLAGIALGAVLGYNEKRSQHVVDHLLALLCVLVTIGVLVWALFGARI
ncbi:MAG: rhomboid family intramembrane serine protease [Trichlorobacter sp.]|uniref:rhomboid family intramembrane serine protease n=1 Tax=Trichlorobacter sp. TaxID=2911007 RepID=UPI00255EC0D3|nr:rhomboid family intramembrane serine protease [Trichlorobacter sp.]MDK9718016.1 rhomboid family intramembrane serine protease [Trichlorobacter sp.]